MHIPPLSRCQHRVRLRHGRTVVGGHSGSQQAAIIKQPKTARVHSTPGTIRLILEMQVRPGHITGGTLRPDPLTRLHKLPRVHAHTTGRVVPVIGERPATVRQQNADTGTARTNIPASLDDLTATSRIRRPTTSNINTRVKTAPPGTELRRDRATRRTHPTTTSRRCRTTHTLRSVRREHVRELLLRPMNHTPRQTSQHLRKLRRTNTLSQALELILQPSPRAADDATSRVLQPAADLPEPPATSERWYGTGAGQGAHPFHAAVTAQAPHLTGRQDVLLVRQHGRHPVVGRAARSTDATHGGAAISKMEPVELVRTEHARNLIPQRHDAFVVHGVNNELDRLLR